MSDKGETADQVIEALTLSLACPTCQRCANIMRALLQRIQHQGRMLRRLRPKPDDWVVEIAKDRRRRAVAGGLVRTEHQPKDRYKH